MTGGVSVDVLTELRDEFPTSSWAVWSSDYPAETSPEAQVERGADRDALYEYIVAHRDRLNPSVIIMGTSPSREVPEDYWNFHSTPSRVSSDYHLKRGIQDANLRNIRGAYMTNIIKEVTEPDQDVRSIRAADIRVFEEELTLLDQPRFDIICPGKGQASALLEERFGELQTLETPEGVPEILTLDEALAGTPVTFYVVYSYTQGNHIGMGQQLQHLDSII